MAATWKTKDDGEITRDAAAIPGGLVMDEEPVKKKPVNIVDDKPHLDSLIHSPSYDTKHYETI